MPWLYIFLFIITNITYASIENRIEQNWTYNKQLGDWSSGGGNVVVCFANIPTDDRLSITEQAKKAITKTGYLPNYYLQFITTIEMLDLYDAKLPRGIDQHQPQLINLDTDETLEHYAKKISSRFATTVPIIQQILEQGIKRLPNNRILFHNTGLIAQTDSAQVHYLPSNCLITTMALQRNWETEYELHIDGRLFNHPKHARFSKAILLLHEYLYTQGRTMGHINSSPTRKLLGYLITRDQHITIKSLIKSIINLGFVTFDSDYDDWRELSYFYQLYTQGTHKLLLQSSAIKQSFDQDHYTVMHSKLINIATQQCHLLIGSDDIPSIDTLYSTTYQLIPKCESPEGKKLLKEIFQEIIKLQRLRAKQIEQQLTIYLQQYPIIQFPTNSQFYISNKITLNIFTNAIPHILAQASAENIATEFFFSLLDDWQQRALVYNKYLDLFWQIEKISGDMNYDISIN